MTRRTSWFRSPRLRRKQLSNHRSERSPTGDSRLRNRRLLLERLEDRSLLAGEVFPNDPLFSSQWPLHNTGQMGGTPDADIDAPEAWSITTGSMATVVAVMDSGIDYTHADLYLNIWLNEGEIPVGIAANLTDTDSDGVITFRDLNSPANASYVTNLNGNSYIDGGDLLADPAWENGLDEDGNGLTDDLIGWGFHNDDNDPLDENGHGTSVSQRLAANGNDGVGMVGVMWAARLMPVRIELINETRFIENCVAGLDYAVNEGATISNNSWGDFIYSQEMYDAIDRARLAGHLFIASAGNDSQDIDDTPRYPAAYNLDNVLSVHAVGATDQLTPAGNWGQVNVDLGSPTDTGANSQATPRVTGVAGLLRTLHPDWTYTQIKDRILATVDQLPSLAGKSVTGGRLNAANALDVAQFSITDATATEGSTALKVLDRFVAEGSGGLDRPRASTFGPDGNGDGAADLYVPSVDTDQVLRYDGVTGAFLDVFIPAGSGGLDSPGDLEFTTDGLLYVTSYVDNSLPHNNDGQLLRYDAATGAFIDFAASGLYSPLGVSRGPDDNLYITNETSDEVLRFDGSTLSVFVAAGSGGLDAPRNAVFGPDATNDGHAELYVASGLSGSVLRYDGQSGAFLGTFATTGFGSGPLWIQFGPDGLLYATVRTTTTSLDTTLLRFDGVSGALVDSFNIGGDHWSFQVAPDGLVYLSGNGGGNMIDRIGPSSLAAFTVTLNSASASPVTVNYSTANGSAIAGSDYTAASDTITFAPGQTSRTILVQTLDNAVYEVNETFFVNLSSPSIGAIISDPQGVATIQDNEPLLTKFYVVDDASANRTFEYAADGMAVENYTVSSGNTAPRGAASNIAGDKVWVVDVNRTVYVYNPSGTLLGSWSVGGFNASAQFEGIATNGTDIWIVDAKSDKVYKYTGAASRINGSQSAASSFSLNSGNKDASDLVTDGTSIWVLNNTSTDKVFKYTVSGAVLGNWSISTAGASAPTGITLDPASPSHLWIVDSGTDRVYQYDTAVGRISGTQAASTSFALAVGNSNPQGIADPPVGAAPASEPVEAAPTLAGVLATSAARLTPQSSIDTQDQAELYLPMAIIDTSRLLADPRWLKTAVSAAVIDAPTSSSHDEALSSIADELEGLIPVRKIKR